jgi:tetratricopeptide (TPR) repeat protein
MTKPAKGTTKPSKVVSSSISKSRAWFIAVPAALCIVVAVTLVLRGNAEWAGFSSKTPSRIETAMAALDRGDLHEAISRFEEAIAARPEDLRRVSAPYARALEGQAAQILKTDPQRAEALLLKARELDPRHVQIHTTLGLLYLDREDYPKAIEAYQSAIELNPRMADIFFNLGYIFAVREDYRRAQEMYARTVDLSPPFLDEALFNLAVIEARLGKHKECVKYLKRALKYNPDNKQVRNYLEKLNT